MIRIVSSRWLTRVLNDREGWRDLANKCSLETAAVAVQRNEWRTHAEANATDLELAYKANEALTQQLRESRLRNAQLQADFDKLLARVEPRMPGESVTKVDGVDELMAAACGPVSKWVVDDNARWEQHYRDEIQPGASDRRQMYPDSVYAAKVEHGRLVEVETTPAQVEQLARKWNEPTATAAAVRVALRKGK